ncbi:MAG: YdcF family protein [Blautia sp.]
MQEKFLQQITDFVFVENIPEKADIIFIPGSGYPQIAEEAAKLYRAGYAPQILPSGRYSILKGKFAGVWEKEDLYGGDYETEWEFLKTVLVKNQVPSEHILREDHATYTYENAIYSRKVTDHLGMEVKKAILCCMPCHARRALLYYQLLFPKTEFLVCPAQESKIKRDNWYLSEEGIETVLGEVERCGSQFHEILREVKEQNS